MEKTRWLAVMMAITILGITGFQVYWLQQNYLREKNTLTLKTDAAFRQTIMRLQASKLKLDDVNWKINDSSNKMVKIFVSDDKEMQDLQFNPKEEMVSTINILREKLHDSLRKKTGIKSGINITMNKTSVTDNDSMKFERQFNANPGNGNHLFNLLYGVDSLQQPLTVLEIDSAFSKKLKKEKLDFPYTIIKKDSLAASYEPGKNEVVLGFVNPVAYGLKPGNTVPYLLQQITQPILFSILLLGITILSFALLYKNLVKQQRLAALKNEFISNITHELKTPIATVGVAIEALKNFNAIDDPVRTKEYLDISQNELQRLSLLVDKVLKLSMFEKKVMELKMEPVNLKEIAEEVTSSMRLQLEKQHATARVIHDGDTTLRGDKMHLQSLIFNLVDNALKYSRENPEIKIHIKEQADAVNLTVKDNGMGIPPEYKEKVFEKFFRVPHGDTHNAKGYGLGLSYAAQVIQQHNGTISLESKQGEGTLFTIMLPKNKI